MNKALKTSILTWEQVSQIMRMPGRTLSGVGLEGEGSTNPALKAILARHGVKNYDHLQEEYRLGLTINGVTYLFFENPEDGYRSCASNRVLAVPGLKLRNHFKAIKVQVTVVDEDRGFDGLLVMGKVTGTEIVKVGTDHADDYYPSMVGNYDVEALNREMLYNLPEAKATGEHKKVRL